MSHALHTLASYPELENFTADMGLQAKPLDLNKQVYGTTFGEQALATKRRLSRHLYFPLIDKVKRPSAISSRTATRRTATCNLSLG